MESIYYVMCWACHRRCAHCYDDRFRPYVRDELEAVVEEARTHFPKIIANLPDQLSYETQGADGRLQRRVGRLILAGGELLLNPVRETVLYPALDLFKEKYGQDGARIILQTTGDLVTPEIVGTLLERGVWLISCAGMDEYHVGMERDRRAPVMDRLQQAFDAHGVTRVGLSVESRDWLVEPGPFYNIMGAEPGSWIGELWPRGRAWANVLSQAKMETNFCARQSGAKGFLNMGRRGSEVAIEPDGSLYPCCLKTQLPVGSVAEEPLTDILESLKAHPAFQALNRGRPDEMGIGHGVSPEAFRGTCQTTTPKGTPYENLCIGCDRYFEARMGPVIEALKAQRQAKRAAAGTSS